MAERNIMNVLYKLRGDTLNNWSTKNPVLAEREPAIVIIPADSNSGLNEPAVLLKIGDGTTAFNDLGYLSAIAGDVPAWAKEANKPSYEAKEITGIDAYIGKCDASNAVEVTLLASAWSSGQQTISVNGLKANQNGIASLPQNYSVAVYEAVVAAQLFASAQGDGTLTFSCNGDVPQIDIPILVILLG